MSHLFVAGTGFSMRETCENPPLDIIPPHALRPHIAAQSFQGQQYKLTENLQ